MIPAPGQGEEALTAAIMAACATQLADFKRPRQVILVPELPRSTLEKIAKAELRSGLPMAG